MKKKKQQVKLNLNCEFVVHVPEENLKKYSEDLKRGELGLTLQVEVNEVFYNYSIFKDYIKDGKFDISPVKNGKSIISITGYNLQDIDEKSEKDLFLALTKSGHLQIEAVDIYDSDANSYYIDGDSDKTQKIGEMNLMEK